MRRPYRLLLVLMVALHGLVAVCGPALHALPGMDHVSMKLVSRHANHPGHGDKEIDQGHDCPVCHFHALGQLVPDSSRGPCIDVVRIRPAGNPPCRLVWLRQGPSIPRAPPIA